VEGSHRQRAQVTKPILYSATAALDKACDMALKQPYTARLFAHVALERAEQDNEPAVGTAALSLYVALGGNFCRAGMA
jgi:hypothetical protein